MKRTDLQHIKINALTVKLPLMMFVVLLASTFYADAQIVSSNSPEKTQTRNGNKQYNDENYTEAEANYKKALDIKNNMPEATFNLGDALYKQKRYDDAGKQFQLSAQNNTEPKAKANGWYNLGNSYMEQKKWEDAVKAYKSALKINPNDADSRYNLAYANEMIKKDKGGKGKDSKDQKDKKNDKKDNKDQKQDKKDDKQQQDKQNQDKQANNQDQKDKQQPGQKSKLSKAETEKLLQALNDEEQKTTQKMLLKQMKTQKVKIQKDW